MIRTVGILCKPRKEDLCSILPPLVEWLRVRNLNVLMDESAAESCDALDKAASRERLASESDLLVVLGGDGTLLAAVRLVGDREIPILGVNLGFLGFLTSVTLDELYPLLEATLADQHEISIRMVLKAQLVRDGKAGVGARGLNDAVINQTASARLMDFDVHVDGNHVSRYRADGIIVATPTGSTAYSLSAGGPIVLPDIHAFLITPICPHMLTNRPLVISDSSIIEIAPEQHGEPVHLTLDGQMGFQLEAGDRVRIERASTRVHLVQPAGKSYFEVLRNKLGWGER